MSDIRTNSLSGREQPIHSKYCEIWISLPLLLRISRYIVSNLPLNLVLCLSTATLLQPLTVYVRYSP